VTWQIDSHRAQKHDERLISRQSPVRIVNEAYPAREGDGKWFRSDCTTRIRRGHWEDSSIHSEVKDRKASQYRCWPSQQSHQPIKSTLLSHGVWFEEFDWTLESFCQWIQRSQPEIQEVVVENFIRLCSMNGFSQRREIDGLSLTRQCRQLEQKDLRRAQWFPEGKFRDSSSSSFKGKVSYYPKTGKVSKEKCPSRSDFDDQY